MNEPIDLLHQVSVRATRDIREWVAARRTQIAAWEPRPYPKPNPTHRKAFK